MIYIKDSTLLSSKRIKDTHNIVLNVCNNVLHLTLGSVITIYHGPDYTVLDSC